MAHVTQTQLRNLTPMQLPQTTDGTPPTNSETHTTTMNRVQPDTTTPITQHQRQMNHSTASSPQDQAPTTQEGTRPRRSVGPNKLLELLRPRNKRRKSPPRNPQKQEVSESTTRKNFPPQTEDITDENDPVPSSTVMRGIFPPETPQPHTQTTVSDQIRSIIQSMLHPQEHGLPQHQGLPTTHSIICAIRWNGMETNETPNISEIPERKTLSSTQKLLAGTTQKVLNLLPHSSGWVRVQIPKKLLKRWEQRPTSFKLSSSKDYQQRLLPFLPLVPLNEERRLAGFLQLARARHWGETTLSSKWTMLLTTMRAMNKTPSFGEQKLQKLFAADAREAKVEFPTPLTAEHCKTAIALLPTDAGILLELSFTLGQRVSDLSTLRCHSITMVKNMITNHTFVCVTLFQGKTVRRLSPYSLHIPAHLHIAQQLINWRNQIVASSGQTNSKLFPTARALIGVTLRKLDPTYTLLSVRRGGLQRMALNGVELDQILHYSRHTTTSMLRRYLNWGAVCVATAESHYDIMENMAL